ncbi:GNAT family N-acetyltransferase [Corynebacterium striatum]|uniref:GNAT family N-acetyltransferase n=1 Tax=Corynebacterium striatum TaxID=43770 RepID=UPI001A352E7A|nr:GNAT family N-acetyltransferase [Corynebacterium striatum]HAT1337723.1 GNAT family N-acetyltransferase [Corynebacterium striatum]HAT1360530.1 GNAT family N-acetyltransferase [Corynebacterium striatum]HAT1365698.1 GNAT family N-acetyltransferase [Corynebacterium striatum]HAT1401230.1 GNAT family N-acetyltransferase [Corynebacterium striatum]
MTANDSAYGVRLAKEPDRTYLSRLLFLADVLGDEEAAVPDYHTEDVGLYIDEWSPLVDGGCIAVSSHNVPMGGAWLRYYTGARKGAAYLGNPEAEPFDESQWATRFDPEEIPELFIAVEHRYRGLGVGRRLLRNICDLAAAQEAPAIALWVDPKNPGARKLYESEGFEDITVPGNSEAPTMVKYFAN